MAYLSFGTKTHRTTPSYRLLHPALATALVLGLGIAPVAAQVGPAPSEPLSIMVADGRGGVAPTDSSGLMAQAQADGQIVIIVGFEAGFEPEGTLDAPARASQRAAISTAQDRVLSALEAPLSVARFESVPYVSMVVTPADLERLLRLPGITSITENVPSPPLLNESVPLIEGDTAWDAGFTGDGWSVAVLDTGSQINHRAFTGSIISGACFSQNVPGRSVSVCPNGNDTQLGIWAGQSCPINVAGCNHGTHVAGIATGDRFQRRGVAPDADLIAVQVFSRFDSAGDCGSLGAPCALSWGSDQVLGLERVLTLHDNDIVPQIASINMSLGGGFFTASCDASNPALAAVVTNLRSRGIATLIASGNNGFNGAVSSPSCVSSAIAVGSTTKTDEVSPFSNHGALVELLAPGSSISAPILSRQRNRIATLSGTSMATPHVAGAWAVLRQAVPDATVDEVLRALSCTGTIISRNGLPRPRINVDAARLFLESPLNRRVWTFRNNSQVQEWTAHLGRWFRPGSQTVMQVRANQPHIWYLASSPFCAQDLRVDTRVRRADNDPDFHWNSGLQLFSAIDTDANMSGMWFAYSKLNGGTAWIWALDRVNGLTASESARLLCRNDAAPINIGGYNNLTVISEGGFHRFLINDVEACSATESSFPVGNVALSMAAPENTPTHRFTVVRVIAEALTSQSATQASTGTLGDGGVSTIPTALGSYQRAPEGGSLPIPSGVTPLGVAVVD